MSLMNAIDVAGTGMNAQQLRLNTVASNLANAETVAGSPEEAYRARQPVFAAALHQAQGGYPQQGGPQPAQTPSWAESGGPVDRMSPVSFQRQFFGGEPVNGAHMQDPWASPSPSVPVFMPGVVESDAEVEPIHKPHHPMADENGYVYRSNVNTVEEMTNMISASRSFQNNVEVMNTSRDLMMETLRLGR
ncbi:flagellar basal body rod protein FlgC [Halorhodospira halochloris]|uniref:Flagellar basal-body rod protein FlgC n=1 Tax=Halorhodospira halochloris TaxID=1052 RepID=A0A110B5U9_HALHR|nr:flagellar basal body rod protein FlgC [Halorhodospira halochloris]MBK1651793.1 flagellar basal body rod protein FlgC [Halorhodospira halochloris]MCG5530017.1 flagellar basal body rod protein FlgC [Halorhodospira halochloris]BAU58872.1 flagellar basal-body rod protein FlgC [Halorhodospira halochloris]